MTFITIILLSKLMSRYFKIPKELQITTTQLNAQRFKISKNILKTIITSFTNSINLSTQSHFNRLALTCSINQCLCNTSYAIRGPNTLKEEARNSTLYAPSRLHKYNIQTLRRGRVPVTVSSILVPLKQTLYDIICNSLHSVWKFPITKNRLSLKCTFQLQDLVFHVKAVLHGNRAL